MGLAAFNRARWLKQQEALKHKEVEEVIVNEPVQEVIEHEEITEKVVEPVEVDNQTSTSTRRTTRRHK